MNTYKNLVIEISDGVATVTIARPEVRNALDTTTWNELKAMVEDIRQLPEVGVVIITGAGEKAFASGADISVLRGRTPSEGLDGIGTTTLWALENLDRVTIAAINGFCLGGGCEVAMACDIRVAVEKAKLGQPECNLGIIPGAGGTQRLPRLVGIGKAKELVFTGDIIDAQEALRIGLVNKVVPADKLLETCKEMAKKIMAKGPMALRLAKLVMNRADSSDIETGLLLERLAQSVAFGSEDKVEGTSAFLEKRPARFKGK